MVLYLVSLYKRYFHIVLWVHIQDIIVNLRIRYLLMIHCPYRSGKNISWNFSNISFKEGGSYNLRSNTSCRHGLYWCWPGLTVEHSSFSYQEYPECSGFQAGAKDLFISFGICPMNSLRSCPLPLIPLCLSREEGMIHFFVGSHVKKPESGLSIGQNTAIR